MRALNSIVSVSIFYLSLEVCFAGPLRFLPVTRPADGSVLLRLETIPGSNYVIEASQHLKYWFPVSSGTASNVSYDFIHQPTNFTALFFRGRFQRTNSPPRLTARVDGRWSASGLATVEGGSCFLTVPGSVTYRLNIPPRTLRDPTVITMTLVSNIVEWPFTNAIDSVIRLEPDSLELSGAAILEIEYPTNVPPNALSSFTFKGDGNGVHLLAARVRSNTVVIPVTHFSFLGAATLPAGAASATATDAYTTQADQVSSRIAEQLRANPNLANDSEFWSDVQADYQNLINRELRPLLSNVTKDCTLGEKVVGAINQARRQFELQSMVGSGTVPPILPEFDDNLCAIYENCKKELKDECQRLGGRGSLAMALAKLSQQGAIFGLGSECGGSNPFTELKPCSPLWYGSIDYSETGSTNYEGSSSRYSQMRSFKVYGYVEEATEIARDGFLILTLDIACTYTGRETYDFSSESVNIAKDHEETVLSAVRTNQLRFILFPGASPGFTIQYAEVPRVTTRTGLHCAPGGECIAILEKSTNTFSVLGLSRNGAETGWVPPNRIHGTYKREENVRGLPTVITFTWDFERNDEYQPPAQ